MKRFRVIKRDIKSFLFELILPLGIIISALFLMRISFIIDMPAQEINLSTYLPEQNPVDLPIGSSDSTLLGNIKTDMISHYGSKIKIADTSTYPTADGFDYSWLFPRKKAQSTLKGGIYYSPSTVVGSDTIYPINTFVATRSSTSPFFLPTIAAQSLINSQFSKSSLLT